MNRTLTVLMTASLLFAGTAIAAPADPADLVKERYARIQKVVDRNPGKAAMRKGIRKVMNTFVDFRELGRRTLKGNWEGLKTRQRKQFVKGFKQMIQRTYVKRFNPNRKVRIEYRGPAMMEEDGTASVFTIVRSGRSEAKVDYRFHRVKRKWKAFDVIIDDVSQVKNYRKQFHRIMKKDGFEGLMAKIRKKNEKEKRKEEKELAKEAKKPAKE
ncbi:MAG: ABC transporter substrate-binding protein [Deltaproteobacteria bacterium]|nr:ABC transporter substrate-binding protein [Deltaproteobacteria bacterium]